ncbi:MAG: ribosome maturation factor RimM [Anaerosomatales bacterium]|nr:ribosome maturation factor RimM [Anaerosomatales bacterium]MDT8433403.1 ribosome maturation factor RimM [Anaerosomatales bacterium]
MNDAPFVPVGRIVKVHGLNGEVSVAVAADPPFSIPVNLPVWVVPPPAGPLQSVVESVRPGPKGPLVKLSGFSNRADAELLRGRTLVARPEDLPEGWSEVPEDDIGLKVTDTERGSVGTVVDVIRTGANDVWVLAEGPYGEVLVPVIDDVVLGIDNEKRTATVRLLPGLIEEDGDRG